MKRITSSPVMVLMSWCMVTTLTPVTFSTIASRTGLGRFNQMGPYLLQQVPPLIVERLDQVLLGCGQNALETHDEEIAEQVGVDVLRGHGPCNPARSG